jgi:hypothetical protein
MVKLLRDVYLCIGCFSYFIRVNWALEVMALRLVVSIVGVSFHSVVVNSFSFIQLFGSLGAVWSLRMKIHISSFSYDS